MGVAAFRVRGRVPAPMVIYAVVAVALYGVETRQKRLEQITAEELHVPQLADSEVDTGTG